MNRHNGLLEGKIALVFGAGGAIGGTVAKKFFAEGAKVFASGRTLAAVKKVTDAINKAGDTADAQELDALDEKNMNTYFERIFGDFGKIDVVFNAIGSRMDGAIHVMPSTDTPVDVFRMYLNNMVTSQFLTARIAAKYMAKAKQGSIILMSATPSRGIAPFLPGASVGHAAIDGMARCLATEFGPLGIRVNAVMSGGMQETANIQQVLAGMAKLAQASPESLMAQVREKSALRRTTTLAETAEAITFLASDRSSSITGAILNASCGEVLD